jgi:hypothetical protein
MRVDQHITLPLLSKATANRLGIFPELLIRWPEKYHMTAGLRQSGMCTALLLEVLDLAALLVLRRVFHVKIMTGFLRLLGITPHRCRTIEDVSHRPVTPRSVHATGKRNVHSYSRS